jgi:hypothetical protein
MGFPQQVNVQPAVAVEGDFASTNTNKFTRLPQGGAFIAGPAGLTVGAFCWADPTFSVLNSFGSGLPTGFVSREGLRADIVTPGPGFPDASMVILGGTGIACFGAGDFYVRNKGTTTSAIGQKAYANFRTGLVTFAATGSPPTDAAVSVGSITANTLNVSSVAVNAFTGSIAPAVGSALAVLTVSAITTGGLYPGQAISNVPGTINPNTTVVAQLTGATPGGVGTYSLSLSPASAVLSGAITGAGGWLTVTSMTNGKVYPGQTWSGGSNAFAAGTTILAGGSGVGVAGTYPVSIAQTLASTATATGSGGFLTVTTITSGTLNPGDTITSTNTPAGTFVLPFGTGATTGVGIAGTYIISSAAGAGDTAMTVLAGIETKYVVESIGAPGELVTISSTALG